MRANRFEHVEVFRAIVLPDAVDMMHDLTGAERSADLVFGDESVFMHVSPPMNPRPYILWWRKDADVPVLVHEATSPPFAASFAPRTRMARSFKMLGRAMERCVRSAKQDGVTTFAELFRHREGWSQSATSRARCRGAALPCQICVASRAVSIGDQGPIFPSTAITHPSPTRHGVNSPILLHGHGALTKDSSQ